MSVKKLTTKQKRQLDKLVRKHYQNWLAVAIKIVGNPEGGEEVVSKTLLYIVSRITSTTCVPVDIPNAAAYVTIAVRCRSLNYLRDAAKMITLSNFDLDKFLSPDNS